MVDERLIIAKLESIKNGIDKTMNVPSPPYPHKYMSPEQVCYLIDKIIEYINCLKPCDHGIRS